MPRPRFAKLPEERRLAILRAAGEELARQGYEKASLNRILAGAGVSKGAAYYYFDDRDDLLATVFTYLWERLLKDTSFDTDSLSAGNYWESLRNLSRQFMDAAKGEPWIMGAVRAIWGLPDRMQATGPFAVVFHQLLGWLQSLIVRGQELGVIRRDMPLSLLMDMMLALDSAADRWLAVHWDDLSAAELQRLSALIFQMWQQALSPVAEPSMSGSMP